MASGPLQGPSSTPPGTITSDVLDNDTQQPTTVLDGGQPFNTQVAWQIGQPLANVLNAAHEWRVEVFADELGGQFDQLINTQVINVPAVPGQANYPAVLVPCTLPGNNPAQGQSALYKIATVVTLVNGNAPTESGGFCDNGLVRTI